ncbi:MAG TPA: hypothetical protein VHY91_05975 [Pirellulales bacterium]|jgi:hypothetical protein|nr:hypothetical protein [Pirellulales bacterium]
MTPRQLAELEIWLAAGFDLPTALAAIGPDEDDEPEPASDDAPESPAEAEPGFDVEGEEPVVLYYVAAFVVAIGSILTVMWLFGI